MGLSKLNFHKFKHNFKDTINPMCPVNDGIEDMENYLLLCNCFKAQRQNLLAGVNSVLAAYKYSENSYINMLDLLLYGRKYLSFEANNQVLRLIINYIFELECFA